MLERDKVKGASAKRLLTDIVSLVKFAIHQEDELLPFDEKVKDRFENWIAQQENQGKAFTTEYLKWQTLMANHIAASMSSDVINFSG